MICWNNRWVSEPGGEDYIRYFCVPPVLDIGLGVESPVSRVRRVPDFAHSLFLVVHEGKKCIIEVDVCHLLIINPGVKPVSLDRRV